jgi:hypothetical protein
VWIADTLAVTDYLRDRFGKDRIYLMAHSGGTFFGVDDHGQVLELSNQLVASPREGVNLRTQADFLWFAAIRNLIAGDRARFRELADEMAAIANRTREPGLLWRPLVQLVIEQTLDGDLEAALATTERLIARGDELGIGMFGRVQAYSWSLPIRQYLGSFDDHVPTDFNERHWHEQVINLPTYAVRGDHARAHEVLTEFIAALPRPGAADPTSVTWLVVALEGAIVLCERQAVELLRRKLAPVATLGGEPHAFAIVGRVLGDAAMVCGDSKAGRAYYEQALQVAKAMRHQPEIALLHVNLAELSQWHDAQQHLDLAIPSLQSMRMRPALGRALALRSALSVDSAYCSRTRSSRTARRRTEQPRNRRTASHHRETLKFT